MFVEKPYKIPPFLYHYTTVDSLALILKNQTIRFNSLDKMDDTQEQLSNDTQNFGKFIFVSSWTNSSKESIPMWKMYAPNKNGVRIKMPSNPFELYEFDVPEKYKFIYGLSDESKTIQSVLQQEQLWNSHSFCSNALIGEQLENIIYKDDKNLLYQNIAEKFNGSIDLELDGLGRFKNSFWKFQKEWRYILRFYPVPIDSIHAKSEADFFLKATAPKEFEDSFEDGKLTLDFDYLDLKIRKECFDKMSLTLSPDISESARLFVEMLLERYNPKCKVRESILKDLIQ